MLLHRRLPAADVIAGITIALHSGATSVDVVAMEACRAQHVSQPGPATADPDLLATDLGELDRQPDPAQPEPTTRIIHSHADVIDASSGATRRNHQSDL